MKHQHFWVLLLCLLLMAVLQVPAFAVDGSDIELTTVAPKSYPTDNWVDLVTENDQPLLTDQTVWHITNEQELAYIAKTCNAGTTYEGQTILLDADLDLSAHQWTPIACSYELEFRGKFLGNGYTIRGLTIGTPETPAQYSMCGLIGHAWRAIVSNLCLHDVYIHNNYHDDSHYAVYTGGIAGREGYISNCAVTGTINGGPSSGVGGIAGGIEYNLEGCYVSCDVSGQNSVGAAVGNGPLEGVFWDQGRSQTCRGILRTKSEKTAVGYKDSYAPAPIEFPVDTRSMQSPQFVEQINSFSWQDGWLDWIAVPGDFPRLSSTSSQRAWPENAEEISPDKQGVYHIRNEAQLAWLATVPPQTFSGKQLTLEADLDLGGKFWKPIPDFQGHFQGNGHMISGLSVGSPGIYVPEDSGLFSILSGRASVQALRLNGSVYSSKRAGLLAGAAGGSRSGTSIDDISVSGTVHGSPAGGLVGYCSGTSGISGAKALQMDVQADRYGAGGIVGYTEGVANEIFIRNACFSGTANGNYAGRIIGAGPSTIENCYAIGTLQGSYVGGIEGAGQSSTLINCYAACNVTGSNTVGGILGGACHISVNTYWNRDCLQTQGNMNLGPKNRKGVGAGGKDPTTPMTAADMQAQAFVDTLNSAYQEGWTDWALDTDNSNGGFPELANTYSHSWIKNAAEVAPNAEGIYEIGSPESLAWIAQQVNSGADTFACKTIRLLCDLDLGGKQWTPIGTEQQPFLGSLDGSGHVIFNLTVGSEAFPYADSAGLFGDISDSGTNHASMRNLGLENVAIFSQRRAGSLCSSPSYNGVQISNCWATGAVHATENAYGLGSRTTNCWTNCTVVSKDTASGVGGYDYQCLALGTVSGPEVHPVNNNASTNHYLTHAPGDGGETLEVLQKQETYQGWDFSAIWTMSPDKNNGLPYLRWQTERETPLTAITFPQDSYLLFLDDYQKNPEALRLKPTLSPVNANPQLTWTSETPTIATVDQGGVVRPIQEGTAKITVTAPGGLSASTFVTVTNHTPLYVSEVRINGQVSNTIPRGQLRLSVAVTNHDVADTDKEANILLVCYNSQGQMVDLTGFSGNIPKGYTFKFGGTVDNSKGNIATIKTLLLDSWDILSPLSGAYSIIN